MRLFDRIKDKATQFKGKTKQEAGRDAGDPALVDEGAHDEFRGKATEAAHKVRDRAKDMADDVKRSVRKK